MSTLRKYRPLPKVEKKKLFTAERTLLVGFVGLSAVGLAQPSLVSMAFNETTPATTMTAQKAGTAVASRPRADYTPVGSIERLPVETTKPAEAPKPAVNPHGLRLER